MSLFGKLFKKNDDIPSAAVIPSEIYRSVHVMRDDINEMEGKPKESIPGATTADSNSLQTNNPFLGESAGAPTTDSESQPSAGVGMTVTDAVGEKKAFIYGSILVVVVIGALIAGYFVFRDSIISPEGAPAVPISPEPLTDNVVPDDVSGVPQGPYSVEMPNYLQIDPESDTATPDGISMKLSDAAEKVKRMNASEPIEFLIRDTNNNPIAFSRFSYLAKLGIPEETLALVDESFSLYFVVDGGEIRFTLALETKDAKKLAAAVSSGESELPKWFGGLLYDSAVQIPSAVSFRSGTHGTVSTRFAIVDASRNYSLDYAFIGKKWVIGTSKESFRAALEKIVIE